MCSLFPKNIYHNKSNIIETDSRMQIFPINQNSNNYIMKFTSRKKLPYLTKTKEKPKYDLQKKVGYNKKLLSAISNRLNTYFLKISAKTIIKRKYPASSFILPSNNIRPILLKARLCLVAQTYGTEHQQNLQDLR